MSVSMKNNKKSQFYLLEIGDKFANIHLAEIQKEAECAINMCHKIILFDLGKTSFIDSSGIGVLLNLHKRLHP